MHLRRLLPAFAAALTFGMLVSYPSRAAVLPKYSVVSKNSDQLKVAKMLDYLERIPDPLKTRINRFRGEVVIFDNVLNLHGLSRNEMLFIGMVGEAYFPNRRKTYVAENDETCGSFHGMTVPELHGYGHMVDHAFGYLSHGPKFALLPKVVGNIGAEDNWAESFGQFYCSEGSRKGLENEFPALYAYFEMFDMKHGR